MRTDQILLRITIPTTALFFILCVAFDKAEVAWLTIALIAAEVGWWWSACQVTKLRAQYRKLSYPPGTVKE